MSQTHRRRGTDNRAVLAVDMGGPIFRQMGMPTEGAADALKLLVQRRYGERVHLISYCDESRQRARRERFEELLFRDPATRERVNFYDWTGIRREHIHFCTEASEKASVCSDLGATHYIENQIDAMKHVRSVPNLYLFHPLPEECARHPAFMQYVFDPEVHPEDLRNSRPILLEREWSPSFVERLLTSHIFRHLQRSGRASLL